MNDNILIVVDNLNGGAGNMAQILAKYLSTKGIIHLLVLSNENFSTKYINSNVSVEFYYSNSKSKIKNLIDLTKKIKQIVKINKIKTIISFVNNNNTICGLSLYFNKKVKLIVSERSNPIVIMPSNKIWTILRRIAYKRADYVSVQFDEFKTFDNSRFIKQCVETPNIILSAPYKREDKKTGVIKFVSCARFAPIKRFDLMIKMFKKVHDINPNTELNICGDGSDREKIIKLIDDLNLSNCVKLLGNTKDVYSVLKECDIYLMTSKQEGFPNALSEGLATGLSAIVFKCHNGISKLVVNEYNGFCVEESNEDEFVDKCLLLSNDYEKINRFGKNSIEIANKYSPENILEIWERIIF